MPVAIQIVNTFLQFSLGSPRTRNCARFDFAGEVNIGEGRPGMKHHVRVDVGIDALARAAVGLIHKLYILARAETFDVRGW